MATWNDPLTPVIWLATGIMIMLIMVFFMVLGVRQFVKRIRKEEAEKRAKEAAHQKALLATAVQIQENERRRIAADLHDDLIGQLQRISMQNRQADLSDQLTQCMTTARSISHDLTPPLLEHVSVTELLSKMAEALRSTHQVDFVGAEQGDGLGPSAKLHLVRIAGEVLTNIVRHAEADTIRLNVRISDKFCMLVIKDNGKGFSNERSEGLGIKNIALRSQLLGGKFRYGSKEGEGTNFVFIFNIKV